MAQWIAIIILFMFIISHERTLKKHNTKIMELDHFAELKYVAALRRMSEIRKQQAKRREEENK